MDVTVRMTDDEFLEFIQWRKDKGRYNIELQKLASRYELLVKKILLSLTRDPKKPSKAKILDQEHAIECIEWAEELIE